MSYAKLLTLILVGLLAGACNDKGGSETVERIKNRAEKAGEANQQGNASGSSPADRSGNADQGQQTVPSAKSGIGQAGQTTAPNSREAQTFDSDLRVTIQPPKNNDSNQSARSGSDKAGTRQRTTTTPSNHAGQSESERPPINAEASNRGHEAYAHRPANPTKRVTDSPVSTFSVDVDTGAYANVRRMLRQGNRPPRDAVRIEELINYFDYDYPIPERGDAPFSITTRLTQTPWNDQTQLLQVGLQGWKPTGEVAPANLVFLIDVSGSMASPKKLDLLQQALNLLVDELDRQDRVSIVTYAGRASTHLEPTRGNQKGVINSAISNLQASGSTNGGAGIRRAYELAEQAFVEEGVNRVLLASDGDFNAGTVDQDALIDLVERRRESGISLTTLGFGTGNYNDQLVEQLADNGNGNHAYIDNLGEAKRVLVNNYAATMRTIAKDVKIQIEFNPNYVAEYRLVGYQNRQLARDDFNNDAVDAGEIGAGHTVTALYELTVRKPKHPIPHPGRYPDPDNRSYHEKPVPRTDEMAFLRLRYKAPGSDNSRLIERPIARDRGRSLTEADSDLRFAAAVAGFGQLLRDSEHLRDFDYGDVLELARTSRGRDPKGHRGEFLQLVELAQSMDRTSYSRRYSEQTRR
jgi:Ca-activated chloride channel family protein